MGIQFERLAGKLTIEVVYGKISSLREIIDKMIYTILFVVLSIVRVMLGCLFCMMLMGYNEYHNL